MWVLLLDFLVLSPVTRSKPTLCLNDDTILKNKVWCVLADLMVYPHNLILLILKLGTLLV